MQRTTSLRCQAMLFDLDGTLIDFEARLRRLWAWWSERRGIPLEALTAVMHGRRAVDAIRMVAPQLDAEAEMEALEAEEVADMHDVHAYPGAHEVLQALSSAPWAIVTSGSRRVAEARIRHTGLPMPAVMITGDLLGNGKPAPDGYLLAAQRLGLSPRDCVVVEDAPIGIEAGKSARMRVIAIAATYPATELQLADVVIGKLADMRVHSNAGGILIELSA